MGVSSVRVQRMQAQHHALTRSFASQASTTGKSDKRLSRSCVVQRFDSAYLVVLRARLWGVAVSARAAPRCALASVRIRARAPIMAFLQDTAKSAQESQHCFVMGSSTTLITCRGVKCHMQLGGNGRLWDDACWAPCLMQHAEQAVRM
jgi:hypothetical protein